MVRVSKEKQKETLGRMKENRYQDMLFLRDIINEKLKWLKEQKKLALEYQERYKKELENIKAKYESELKNLANKVIGIDGAIVTLNEITNLKPKEVKAEKAKAKKEEEEAKSKEEKDDNPEN